MMNKCRKRFTTSQKLEIVNYYKQYGGAKATRRYDVAMSSIISITIMNKTGN